MSRPRPRVLVAGLGETGTLTAVRLARRYDVVGVSAKPALVSGQELGLRLAEPDRWSRDHWVDFEAMRALDRARVVHGELLGLDLRAREVTVRLADQSLSSEPYDVLVISTGVTNGFWRRAELQSSTDVAETVRDAHDRLAHAESVAVVGGGAAAVSVAGNVKRVWPGKAVDLYFPGDVALTQHSRRVWPQLRRQLEDFGVGLHPGHRAVVPPGAEQEITAGPVEWGTGQDPAGADAVVWAIGRARPNTGWLPAELLDEDGYVRAGLDLRVPGADGVFAIGDVAATDPLRSSARNLTHRLLARNIRAHLEGRPLRSFRPPHRRWGSVLGYQPEGMHLYAPNGRQILVRRWLAEKVMQRWIMDVGFYRGIRQDRKRRAVSTR